MRFPVGKMKGLHLVHALTLGSALVFSSCQSKKTATVDFADGRYEGIVDRSGRKHGMGVYDWNDGSRYEGNFHEDKRHGRGRFSWKSGDVYEGDYLHGARTGKGTYRWKNGSIYIGEYLNGKRHGKGTQTFADGRVKEGIWKDNKFHYAQKLSPTVTARKSSPPPKSAAEKENERLRKEIARLKKEKQSKPKQVAKKSPPKKSPQPKVGSTGSGCFVSKLGHILTNEHVVRKCGSVTVGDNTNNQVTASVLE